MCFSVGFISYCLLFTLLLFTARTDLGGGGGGRSFLGIQPPAYPKGSPFVLFCDIHIKWRTLWSLAPTKTNFGGSARQKTRFFGEIFPKKAQKNDAIFGLFFQKFACGAQNLAKTGSFYLPPPFEKI